MAPRLYLFALTALASLGHAWLPAEQADEPSDLRHAKRNSKRWLPPTQKIRGVNLGSLFVFEPWMAGNTWNAMCGEGVQSEFDCMIKLGQAQGDAAFQKHWGSFITEADFDEIVSYGLNTVRIPLGYWMDESIVYGDSEHFPRGGFQYLKQVVGWARDKGIYVILNMHGAPGAQVAKDAFTGQFASTPGFYQTYQYDRGIAFLSWLTEQIWTNDEFRNVFMLEVVNEPVQGDTPETLRSYFYPKAYDAIRDKEQSLGITPNNGLHIQFMGSNWGSGDPKQYLSSTYFAAYDDHRYLKWAGTPVDKDTYISTSCGDDRQASGESPTVVGEFSLSVPDDVQWTAEWEPSGDKDFYKRWFAAQVSAYEKYTYGWVFWSWKTELGDYRWTYKDAVAAGVIPKDLDTIASSGVC